MVTFASSGPSIRNIEAIHVSHPFVARQELSPIFGDGLKDQAAAVWD
jgi:hypothetical protein